MQISARAEYGVRAITYLALHRDEVTQVSDISEAEGISIKALEPVLGELKKAGIVASKRGVGGGYTLARTPEDISVGEVIRVFEAELGPVGGIERMRSRDNLTDAEHCLRSTWLKAADALTKILDSTTFAAVAAERREGAKQVHSTAGGTAWF